MRVTTSGYRFGFMTRDGKDVRMYQSGPRAADKPILDGLNTQRTAEPQGKLR